MNTPKLPKNQSVGWWKTFGLGLVLLGLTVYLYLDMTRIEAMGGTYRVRGFTGFLYAIGGKWGSVLAFGLMGLAMLYLGIQELREKRP